MSSFLRYCFESQWIPRIPALPKMTLEAAPTMPLTTDEFKRVLAAVPVLKDTKEAQRLRCLLLLMRYSGLAIRDALTLPRRELRKEGEHYLVVTARQKTGTDVSVPLPPAVAEELLGFANENPEYLLWSGTGREDCLVVLWCDRVGRAFDAAGITRVCHMVSHRLRDTFAVDLLEKGVPLEEVSKLLGHESIRTTEKHYAKWVKGRQDRLIALVTGTWAAA